MNIIGVSTIATGSRSNRCLLGLTNIIVLKLKPEHFATLGLDCFRGHLASSVPNRIRLRCTGPPGNTRREY
jgi:hypothetical protein